MIFDENYDRSLWLIIKNDKKNRDRIINFIKSIPSDFVLGIQNTLVEYNKYKLENEGIPFNKREYRSFHGEMYDGVEYLYSFNIDIENDTLYVSRNRYRYAVYFNDFELLLKNYNNSEEKLFTKQEIGSISYDFSDNIVSPGIVYLGTCTDIDYKIMGVPFGNVLLSSIDNKDNFRLCGIDFEEIPVLHDLDDMKNKLVRSRKRSTGKDKYDI